MLSYMSCLYILEIKFLIGCIFYKYLILYYGLSFYGFLCHAKAFNLVPPFVFIILGGGSKKSLLQFMSKIVLPVFSSKSFYNNQPLHSGL